MGERRLHIVVLDRAGAKRLGILFVILALAHTAFYYAVLKMPGQRYEGPFAALSPAESRLRDELRATVQHVAGTIGVRNLYSGGLDETADWLREQLREAGYTDVREQVFEAVGTRCRNIIAELPGGLRVSEIVVIGAHYDSVPTEECPAANDNGSGVAATLALVRALHARSPERTIRFVFFANEEPPNFWEETMGSLVYARSCRAAGDDIVAMLTPETLGYYTDEPDSQEYPGPFAAYYGTRGNFVAFVGDVGSKRLVRRCVGAFRRTTAFPSEGIAAPACIPGIGWSDHWSFWQVGYPGVMVTDTAPYRYQHYHQTTDTPDRLCYDQFARVVWGLGQVVAELSGSEPPVF